MKFFVTGVNGQLGHDVINELKKRGHEGVGSDLAESYAGDVDGSAITTMPYIGLDITDNDAVRKVITEIKPDAVIHCAAWTAVDMAEDDDKVEIVRKVNVGGTQNIVDVCKEIDCKMLYLSTDYVFVGQGTEPWQPDCKDYKPLNIYGQAKLVSCLHGKIYSVAVDLLPGENFGYSYGEVLSFENQKQMYIPRGFAHDHLTLEDDTLMQSRFLFELRND